MSWDWLKARPCAVATVLLTLMPSAFAQTPMSALPHINLPEAKPAFEARGDEVEVEYKAYTERLKRDFDLLRATVKVHAPALLKKLSKTPPKPVPYGYQILPKITEDEVQTSAPVRASSNAYSWQRTRDILNIEIPKLEEFEEKLSAVKKLEKKDQTAVLEGMVNEYPKLEELQRLVDSHLQYNRFWQKAIADDKPRFNNQTRLHDLVLERQQLLDELLKKIDIAKQQQADQIQRLIQGETIDKISVPGFLKTHQAGPVLELVMTLYTDIEDKKFLARVMGVFNSRWRYQDAQVNYRLKINLVHVPGEKLYGSKAKVPKHGEHIDVYAHAKRFPLDGAVLTTGTNNTFAIPSRFVALGPQPISENVLAHEFGHLLGFIDGYLRGYRDLGDQGFQVMEVIPDPTDIMCMPAFGKVQRRHFEKIFESVSVQSTSKK